MQWRIINDRREILRITCDKRATKRLVAQVVSDHNIQLKVPRQIAWAASANGFLDQLRNEYVAGRLPPKWVMKPNHSSGRALAVDGAPDWRVIEQAARAWLAPSRFLGLHWIWPYAIAESGLLAEEFVSSDEPPIEWQLWIVNNLVTHVVVQQRSDATPRRSYYDFNWATVSSWYPRDTLPMDIKIPPANWNRIEEAALKLAVGWDLIRVDLFEDTAGNIWFSELTPYPNEGLLSGSIGARVFDQVMGAAWTLPVLADNEKA